MTLDERLEYIATLQQTHDEQIGRLFEKAAETEEIFRSLGIKTDERIAALAGRVDAIAEHADGAARRVDALGRHVDALAGHMGTLTGKMDVLTERTIQAMAAINRLARIADNHEDRIGDLENLQ